MQKGEYYVMVTLQFQIGSGPTRFNRNVTRKVTVTVNNDAPRSRVCDEVLAQITKNLVEQNSMFDGIDSSVLFFSLEPQ